MLFVQQLRDSDRCQKAAQVPGVLFPLDAPLGGATKKDPEACSSAAGLCRSPQ